MENDVGYATMLMADHGKMRETCQHVGDPQWENKEALFRYFLNLRPFVVMLLCGLFFKLSSPTLISSNNFSKKHFYSFKL
jgi:hypothetical protein